MRIRTTAWTAGRLLVIWTITCRIRGGTTAFRYITNIQKSGVPVWFDKNLNNVWLDRETPHYVYLGSTGSGKSVTAVIPTCSFIATAKEKRSVFITDPKGEIFNTTSKMFKDNGYEIICIDFRNPQLSNRINILEPIIKEYEEYMVDLCQLFRHIFSNNIYLTVFKFIPISFWQAEIFLIFYSRLFD